VQSRTWTLLDIRQVFVTESKPLSPVERLSGFRRTRVGDPRGTRA
jgi:hypothetical protein